MIEIEWDKEKAVANWLKHSVSFARAADFAFDTAIYFPDDRKVYGEERMRSIGFIDARLHVLVFTMRGMNVLRVISLRKANNREQEVYHASKKRN